MGYATVLSLEDAPGLEEALFTVLSRHRVRDHAHGHRRVDHDRDHDHDRVCGFRPCLPAPSRNLARTLSTTQNILAGCKRGTRGNACATVSRGPAARAGRGVRPVR